MSIKTLPADNGRPIIIAIAASIVAHGVLAGLLVVMHPISDALIGSFFEEPSEPVIVDVIELPPDAASTKPPRRPSFYSDRNHSVEKETWPLQQGAQTVVTGSAPSENPPPSPPFSKGGELPASIATRGGDSHPSQPAAVSKPSGRQADDGIAVPQGGKPVTQASDKGQGVSADGKPVVARPNLFPSKERLDTLARTYVAEAPKGETGKVLSLNTSEIRYQRYLINMKNKIENLWEYPPVAVRNGWQGSLKIDFTIKRDGTVSEIKLVKSSNNPVLDDAAITVLRLSAPFTPFPEDFAVEEITIKGEFVYVIANTPAQ